jgi:hypothetical protein
MSSRPILSGTPTVEVNQARYDELLHYEERLNTILKMIKGCCTIEDVIKLAQLFDAVNGKEVSEYE